jgi:hypothetical protein
MHYRDVNGADAIATIKFTQMLMTEEELTALDLKAKKPVVEVKVLSYSLTFKPKTSKKTSTKKKKGVQRKAPERTCLQ